MKTKNTDQIAARKYKPSAPELEAHHRKDIRNAWAILTSGTAAVTLFCYMLMGPFGWKLLWDWYLLNRDIMDKIYS